MNSLETLMYLMGEQIYGCPSGVCDSPDSSQSGSSGCLAIVGPVPSWLSDLQILIPHIRIDPGAESEAGDWVLITDPAVAAEKSGFNCIIGYKGKKTLWNSLLASGMLYGRQS
jgi:hypothetical protein